jgi:hypothetical protein
MQQNRFGAEEGVQRIIPRDLDAKSVTIRLKTADQAPIRAIVA